MAKPLRRASFLLLLLPLVACAPDPIRFIPPTDRTLLEAQARLGEGGAARQPGRITVAELLAKARAESPAAQGPAARTGLVLRYMAAQVQPDDAQRRDVEAFAVAARGAALVTVASRPAGYDGGEASLIGERRALAVARLIRPEVPNVELRFEAAIPQGEVLVLLGGLPAAADTRR
ncbi:hypothetical protein E2C06_08675 [Dankookia rubra]|uniref:Lipoprotein n=1 Tax=Dankookia rubra TaxID=1442381 RepID=A0A4R5QK61_9PROT|nr:hypothetical protein [Dankookia rubra]TDH63057.1 hypothetical protein E2C06_08675 [Dankookia rubra]